MRRGRVLILFALLIIVVVAAILIVPPLLGDGFFGPAEEADTSIYTVEVVFAAQDIARGSIIPADGVISAQFPSEYLVETMVMDMGQVVGRRARMDIARGTPVTINMVTDEAGDLVSMGSDAAMAIEAGYTAIAMPIQCLSSVAYAIRPGDSVDVLGTFMLVDLDSSFQSLLPNVTSFYIAPDGVLSSGPSNNFSFSEEDGLTISGTEPMDVGRVEPDDAGNIRYVHPSEEQRPRLVSQRLIQKATVLYVGTFALNSAYTPPPVDDAAVEGAVAIEPPDVVTLIVSFQDALILNWAMNANVKLALTLRGPDDLTDYETSSVTLQYIIQNKNVPVPAQLPYGLNPRLDKIEPIQLNDYQAVQPPQQ